MAFILMGAIYFAAGACGMSPLRISTAAGGIVSVLTLTFQYLFLFVSSNSSASWGNPQSPSDVLLLNKHIKTVSGLLPYNV